MGGAVFNSTCQNNFGQSTPVTGRISLTNAANCTYSGYINQTYTGITDTITEATVAENRLTASGVGTFSNGGFVFTMVKVR